MITDTTGRANELNFYYSTIFSGEDSIQHTQGINSANPFTIDIKTIGRNKSVGSDNISGEKNKMGGEAMIPYLACLLEMTINNGTLLGD